MQLYNTEHRQVGVNFFSGKSPRVTVFAPHVRKLTIEIEGKSAIPLRKQTYGYWQAKCPGLMPGDRYLFNIDGKHALPDPASLSQPSGVHQASECIDLNEIRKIRDKSWPGISISDLVIYELHTGTFTTEGTFKAILEKLDHLKDLGVNALSIMPVASFPGTRNWGYDGVFPFAVQHAYGGPFDFARLIKACHRKGIAVILDVVYNHMGPEGNCLNEYAPYFTNKYKTPWGHAINFDDAWSHGVRQYFLENALMWFRDFHIDGLRLDAVHAIKDLGPKHFLQELSEAVRRLNESTGAKHFLIGECDLNDVRFVTPLSEGGYGLNAQLSDEWHHALHALLTGERKGYYSDFGKLEHLIKAFNHAYVYTGNYSAHRKKFFGTSSSNQPGQRFVVFTQNHDQAGNRMLGERLSSLVDFESLKLAAGAMFVSPFVPMLFMGEEYAEENPFLYFVSHSDQGLLEQVKKGRKREFREFNHHGIPPDPASVKSFEQSRLCWDWQNRPNKRHMLLYYKKLIALRKEHKLLKPGNRDNTLAYEAAKDKAIMLSKKDGNEQLIALMNFSEENILVEIPELLHNDPDIMIYSAHKQWGGAISNTRTPIVKNRHTAVAETERKSILIALIKKK